MGRGSIFLLGAGIVQDDDTNIFLRKVTPHIFMQPEWEVANIRATGDMWRKGFGGIAVGYGKGHYFIARQSMNGDIRVTKMPVASETEDPVTLGVTTVKGILADIAVSERGVIWALLYSNMESNQGDWFLLNMMTGVYIKVASAAPLLDVEPKISLYDKEETILVSIPAGDDGGCVTYCIKTKQRTSVIGRYPFHKAIFSPCGRWIAYLMPSRGENLGLYDVIVSQVDFSNPVVVAKDEWVYDISWTVDSSHIILLCGGAKGKGMGRCGVLNAVSVETGLGVFEIYRPEGGEDEKCIFLRCNALGFSLGRKAEKIKPVKTIATVTKGEVVEALNSHVNIEPAIPYIEILAKVERGLDIEIARALMGWGMTDVKLEDSLLCPLSVPRIAKLLIMGSLKCDCDIEGSHNVANKALDLLYWVMEIARGLRRGIPDEEVMPWIFIVRLCAGILLGFRGRLSGRFDSVDTGLAYALILDCAKKKDFLNVLGLLEDDLLYVIVGRSLGPLDSGEKERIRRMLDGAYAICPYRGLSKEFEIHQKISGIIPYHLYQRVKGPYSTLSDVARDFPDPHSLETNDIERFRVACLVDRAIANVTWKPATAMMVRRHALGISAYIWLGLSSIKRFLSALSLWALERDTISPFDKEIIRAIDECVNIIPDGGEVLLYGIKSYLSSGKLDDEAIFLCFRATYSILTNQWPYFYLSNEMARECATIMVACQRLLKLRGSDPDNLASTLVETLEQEGMILVEE